VEKDIDKIQGYRGRILPIDLWDLLENLCRYEEIVERKENTKLYVGIIEHMWARRFKFVEAVSGTPI